jgi:hypothetical protein
LHRHYNEKTKGEKWALVFIIESEHVVRCTLPLKGRYCGK